MYQALIEGVEIAFGPSMPPPPPAGLCYSQAFFPQQVSACCMRDGNTRNSLTRSVSARALPTRQYHLPPMCVEGQARETKEYAAQRAAQAKEYAAKRAAQA